MKRGWEGFTAALCCLEEKGTIDWGFPWRRFTGSNNGNKLARGGIFRHQGDTQKLCFPGGGQHVTGHPCSVLLTYCHVATRISIRVQAGHSQNFACRL